MKIKISDKMYEEIARTLLEEIDGESYISTKIRIERTYFAVEFSLSAMVQYSHERVELDRSCYGEQKIISDLIPIWWECHTYWFEEDYEREVGNDAEFNKLKRFLNYV